MDDDSLSDWNLSKYLSHAYILFCRADVGIPEIELHFDTGICSNDFLTAIVLACGYC